MHDVDDRLAQRVEQHGLMYRLGDFRVPSVLGRRDEQVREEGVRLGRRRGDEDEVRERGGVAADGALGVVCARLERPLGLGRGVLMNSWGKEWGYNGCVDVLDY